MIQEIVAWVEDGAIGRRPGDSGACDVVVLSSEWEVATGADAGGWGPRSAGGASKQRSGRATMVVRARIGWADAFGSSTQARR